MDSGIVLVCTGGICVSGILFICIEELCIFEASSFITGVVVVAGGSLLIKEIIIFEGLSITVGSFGFVLFPSINEIVVLYCVSCCVLACFIIVFRCIMGKVVVFVCVDGEADLVVVLAASFV